MKEHNKLSIRPPVILVHGMWGDQNTLNEVGDVFIKQGYSVDSICLPGHRKISEYTQQRKKQLGETSLQQFVDYLVGYIRQLPVPPILVGHSLGGLLVQLAAVRIPCEKLILLSSAAPAGIVGLGISVFRTLGMNMLRFPLWKSVTELNLRRVQYGIANSQSLATQQNIVESATYESGRVTFQLTMASFLNKRSAAWVDSEKIRCPVLIIGGTEDRITPFRVQRSISQRFGNQATLVEIPGCCHWTIAGKYLPDVHRAILKWLAGY
mgnify:CR=1 FL=1